MDWKSVPFLKATQQNYVIIGKKLNKYPRVPRGRGIIQRLFGGSCNSPFRCAVNLDITYSFIIILMERNMQ